MISQKILKLVCPIDKCKLRLSRNHKQLKCTRCGREYPIKNGIPIMSIVEYDNMD